MAAPIQTLALDGHYSIFRRIIAPTRVNRLGGGAMQVRRLYQRPIYEFVLRDSMRVQADAEYLYSFMQYHQGDTAFLFSGNEWGEPSVPLLFGFGDGTRTEFYLNNRTITSGTILTYQDGVLDSPLPTIDLTSGLLTYFAGAPANGKKLTAKYTCLYKCVFASEQELLQNEELFYQALFRYEGIVLRELVP